VLDDGRKCRRSDRVGAVALCQRRTGERPERDVAAPLQMPKSLQQARNERTPPNVTDSSSRSTPAMATSAQRSSAAPSAPPPPDGVPRFGFAFADFLQKEYRFGLDPGRPACKAFREGHCPLGNGCPDRHQANHSFNNLVCKHWLRGLCKKGDQCEFLHEYNLWVPPARADRPPPRAMPPAPRC
jgi:hypothetical protein